MQDLDTSDLDDKERQQLIRLLEKAEDADSKPNAVYFDEDSRNAISGIRQKITT
jgi:alpha-D-ribose 1-methylphosphonate 5-triphosphate synthase subunit PhnL